MSENKYDILKRVNDITSKHDELKSEIINILDEINHLEENVNKKIEELDVLEKEYVDLVGKLV